MVAATQLIVTAKGNAAWRDSIRRADGQVLDRVLKLDAHGRGATLDSARHGSIRNLRLGRATTALWSNGGVERGAPLDSG